MAQSLHLRLRLHEPFTNLPFGICVHLFWQEKIEIGFLHNHNDMTQILSQNVLEKHHRNRRIGFSTIPKTGKGPRCWFQPKNNKTYLKPPPSVTLQSSNMPFCSNPCPREGVPHKDMPGVWPWHWKTSTHKPKKCFKSFLKEMVKMDFQIPLFKSWEPQQTFQFRANHSPPKKNKRVPQKNYVHFPTHTPLCTNLHPWKLTWHWKIPIFNRTYISRWWMFSCHVSFRGATH